MADADPAPGLAPDSPAAASAGPVGPATDPTRQAARRRELDAIDAVIQRLQKQFPQLAPDEVAAAVRDHYHRFEASPIRDFIPILVERTVRAGLAAR